MGMDVQHYLVNYIISEDKIPTTFQNPHEYGADEKISIEQNNKMFLWNSSISQWLTSLYPDIQPRQTAAPDWELYLDTLGYNLEDWEVTAISDRFPDTQPFIEITNIQTNETKLLSDNIPMINYEFVFVNIKELGYMRKPFQHSDTEPYVENDTLVFTVTNFSDQGKKALELLKKIDPVGAENCCVYLFDINQVFEFTEFSNAPNVWKENFYNNFEKNSFIYLSW